MNNQFENKKLLVLGGKPMGSCEIVSYAQSLGLYTIVADYLPVEESPAKAIADEHWDVSTSDLDTLSKMSKEHNIDGVIASVHEFNIEMSLRLSEILGLPSYCTVEQWIESANKSKFKQLCIESGLPVARTYDLSIEEIENNQIKEIEFPVITKPVDSSGSRGFAICNNIKELKDGFNNALEFSHSKEVMIEEYIEHESIVAIYTVHDGQLFFSGIEDKYPRRFEDGGSIIAGLHTFPSIYTDEFREKHDTNIKNFVNNLGLKNGFLWFEIFIKEDQFIFNEMGLRYSGSLTFYPVDYLFNQNQLYQYIHLSLFNDKFDLNSDSLIHSNIKRGLNYCILPTQVKAGRISKITGIDDLHKQENVVAFAQLKHEGDLIENWGTGQQSFGYIHVVYSTIDNLRTTLRKAINTVKVLDADGNNMIFTLFDIEKDHIKS